MQVAQENHRRRQKRRIRVVEAAVTAHLSGLDGSFVLRKAALMASLRGHDGFAVLLIGFGKIFFFFWVKQQCIAALYGAHLASPFAATGNLKLLPSGTVGSKRPD